MTRARRRMREAMKPHVMVVKTRERRRCWDRGKAVERWMKRIVVFADSPKMREMALLAMSLFAGQKDGGDERRG